MATGALTAPDTRRGSKTRRVYTQTGIFSPRPAGDGQVPAFQVKVVPAENRPSFYMSNEATPHFGVCIRNQGCEDLQLLKLYQILPDPTAEGAGLIRVVDDSGEDYLYPAENFIPVSLPATVEQVLLAIPVSLNTR
jgi:hypothetical protein